MEYSFVCHFDKVDPGYVIEFPDLRTCISQCDTIEEVPLMATEVKDLWCQSMLDHGMGLPDNDPVNTKLMSIRMADNLVDYYRRRANHVGLTTREAMLNALNEYALNHWDHESTK